MNKNENYEGQEKSHKKKHARTTNKQEKVPIYTTPVQPMIYQPQMITQPQPIIPITPMYQMMQPVQQQMPQRIRLNIPIGPPQTVVVPIGQPVPINQPINQQPICKTPKHHKKIIIIRERYREEDGGCCTVF